jgi:hypothetical protein
LPAGRTATGCTARALAGGRLRAALLASSIAFCITPRAQADDDAAVDLRYYGDAGYSIRNHAPVNNSFQAAHFELFPSASIDRLSFLAEVMFEAESDNEISPDVERMQVAYLVADWLRIKAGRMHTAYGYYNDAYHHGAIFELATERPYLANFEDSDGLLEAHIVGAAVDGKLPLTRAADLHYDLEVGNGRGWNIGEVTTLNARKNAKMINGRLRFLPHFVDGLIIGGNLFYDEIPAAPAGPDPTMIIAVPYNLREIVAGAHVVYMEHDVHFLAEGSYIHHAEDVTRKTYVDYGGFVELGYTLLSVLTPYVRYEQVMLARGLDPLYQEIALFQGAHRFRDARAGVKWMATENIALKLEGRTLLVDPGLHQQSLTLQAAFGF